MGGQYPPTKCRSPGPRKLWLPNRPLLLQQNEPARAVGNNLNWSNLSECFAGRHRRIGKGAPLYFILLLLFAASGCAALIYEVVWYQLLQLAIGSTSISMGILLATYMGGLCIGSLWLPRRRWTRHPLRVYAGLEAGIAVFALLTLITLPLLNRLYVSAAGTGLGGMLMRGVLAGGCLLPSTILMGASLPAIVRWIKGTPSGVAWWGYLYGGNTVGAVVGCLLAGFYLLRIFSMTTATLAAVAINLAVAALAWVVAPHMAPDDSQQ